MSVIQAASEARKIIDIAYISQGTINLSNGIPNNGLGFCIGNPSNFPADSHFSSGQLLAIGVTMHHKSFGIS